MQHDEPNGDFKPELLKKGVEILKDSSIFKIVLLFNSKTGELQMLGAIDQNPEMTVDVLATAIKTIAQRFYERRRQQEMVPPGPIVVPGVNDGPSKGDLAN
jgi:hypothetical protein